MTIDKIVLENVGLYSGRNELALTPDGPSKPVVLIGGMNGAGKTTLLDSFQLGLYGAQAAPVGRSGENYKSYLAGLIHHNVDDPSESSIAIEFRRLISGKDEYIALTRSWRQSPKGIVESLQVSKNGELDTFLSENWTEFIESYLPARLANLFFFDGEQIKELADENGAAQMLSTAVHTLLGLDLVDQLGVDLGVLERKQKMATLSSESQEALKQVGERVNEARLIGERAAQSLGVIQNRRDRLANEITTLQGKLRSEGGDLFERLKEIERDEIAINAKLAITNSQLHDIAASWTPLLVIGDQLKAVQKQLEVESDFEKHTLIFRNEENRDIRVLRDLKLRKLQSNVLQEVEALLKRHRTSKPVSPKHSYMGAPNSLKDHVQHLRSKLLPTQSENIAVLLREASDHEEKLSRIQKSKLAVPDKEALGNIHEALQSKVNELNKVEAELQILQEKSRLLNKEAEQLDSLYRRKLEEQVDERSKDEDAKRILEHSPKVRSTLDNFRIQVVRKNANKLESLILESFKALLRKDSLVSSIRIDPETFRLELSDYRGLPFPFSKLSAGERQLLATSLVWGLARASGRTIPTIIDTPLGRLDSSHRHLLVDRYFPFASHQVILLSTDEEIAPKYHEKLNPFISKTYHLRYESKEKRTVIENNYFPHIESAHRNT